MKNNRWAWANHRPGENYKDEEAYGFSLSQITSHATIAGIPFENLNQGRTLGGRIQRIEWPVLIPETFASAIAQLPAGASPDGDEDNNGVSNLVQWAMGQDMTEASWSWRNYPATSRPSVEEAEPKRIRFVIPPLTRGWSLDADVMISTDLLHWTEATDARWEQIESRPFGTYVEQMQPISIPIPENSESMFIQLRLK